MGYYNAFSFLEEYSDDPILQKKINTLLPELTGLIEAYNGALQQVQGVTYVDTYDSMDKHLEENTCQSIFIRLFKDTEQ